MCTLHVCCDRTRDPVAGFSGVSIREREGDHEERIPNFRSLNNSDCDRCRGTRTRKKSSTRFPVGDNFFTFSGPGVLPGNCFFFMIGANYDRGQDESDLVLNHDAKLGTRESLLSYTESAVLGRIFVEPSHRPFLAGA